MRFYQYFVQLDHQHYSYKQKLCKTKNLSNKGNYTVFAPTDAAFQALLAELGVTADQLLSNQQLLTRFLRYHIVANELESAELLSKRTFRTLGTGVLR